MLHLETQNSEGAGRRTKEYPSGGPDSASASKQKTVLASFPVRARGGTSESRRVILIAIALAAFSFGRGLASGATYYVATNGSDSATGTLAAPFATLEKARNSTAPGDTVFVRGGIYFRTNTFTLTTANSGSSAASPTVYRNYTNETPILVGGLPIVNFTTWRTNIMVTDVSTQGFGGIHFRQLYFNGAGQRLARYPNYNGIGTNSYSFVVSGGSSSQFTYKAGDIRTYANPTEVQVFMFPGQNYGNSIVSVSSIDSVNHIVYLSGSTDWGIVAANRYFVQNAFEELDAPGEWYLDSTNKWLYFYPSNTITGATPVYAPVASNLVTFASGAANITFQGFTLECCSGTAIALTGTTNCLVAANTIFNVGDFNGSGVSVSGGFTNAVVGNDISYAGNSGVFISGGTSLTLTPANNYADNNYIHHIGIFNAECAGVWLQGVGNRASRNLIHNSPRWGVLLAYGQNLMIQSNHMYACMMETDDGATIYGMNELWNAQNAWLSCRGSVVAMNYLHDSSGYGWSSGSYLPSGYVEGIYMDDMVSGVNIVSNIVCRFSNPGIYIHSGRDNWIFNNIVAYCTNGEFLYQGLTTSSSVWTTYYNNFLSSYNTAMTYPVWTGVRGMGISPSFSWPNEYMMGANILSTNIAYYSSVQVLGSYYYQNLTSNTWNYNTVWNGAGQAVTTATVGGNYNWATWRGLGYDVNSTNGDPLFAEVSTDNFALATNSPALALGFHQITTNNIGPYNDPLRATWPIGDGPGATDAFRPPPPEDLRAIVATP